MYLSSSIVGVGFSLAAAAAHSSVESLRKHASSSIPLASLVALPALLEAVICLVYDSISPDDGPAWQKASDGSLMSIEFVCTVILSAVILLFARTLYQRALSMASLSLTVPFLSATPVFLVFIAYIFLNELPSSLGLVGVLTVALGGYLLGKIKKKEDPITFNGSGKDESTDLDDLEEAASSSVFLLKGAKSHRRNTGSSLTDSPSLSNLTSLSTRGSQGGDLSSNSKPASEQLFPPVQLLAPVASAPLIMLFVALLFSITSSLDKLGLTLSPLHTVFVYVTFQRIFIAILTSCSLAMSRPMDFRFLLSHFRILLAIAAFELCSVLFFLAAIDHLHVAYVVAIKRVNILFSVLVGAVFFKEPVRERLPYVLLMMAGCVLIVIEPEQSAIHHELHHHRPVSISIPSLR
jgi:drug/metabolite transporter (DMT)-like permease